MRAANSAQQWIVKETVAWRCLVPDSSWRVLATDGGIDISPPRADEDVAYAEGGWTGTQLSAGALATNAINFMSVTTGDLINASITTNGIQTVLPAGRVQRFDFTATHRWLYGVQPVVGYMYVLTSPKGWQVSRQYQPPTKRAADEAMLDFIRTHITPSGRMP